MSKLEYPGSIAAVMFKDFSNNSIRSFRVAQMEKLKVWRLKDPEFIKK